MPNIRNFNNRQIVEPGVYSRIVGKIPSPAAAGTYGNVMLIDTGSGAGFGFGSGIIGDNEDDTVYAFGSADEFRTAVRGGRLWDLVDYLFNPSRFRQGVNTLYYARAATTAAAKFTLDFDTGNGTVEIIALNEGTGANGVLTSGILTLGYGLKIKSGVIDTDAFILELYEGSFKGLNSYGLPYDGIAQADLKTYKTLVTSPEFTTANQLTAWMDTSADFKAHFKRGATTASAVALTSAILSDYGAAISLFAGGTTAYSTSALDAVLESIVDLDASMFICDDYGINTNPDGTAIQNGTNKGAMSAFNLKIIAHAVQNATDSLKGIYIGGGQDGSQFETVAGDGSLDAAKFFNNPLVHIMHSAQRVPLTVGGTGDAYQYVDSGYFAAMVCGLNAGLLPQDSATYKDLRVLGPKHIMKRLQRESALKCGVVHMKNVRQLGWVINQMVNTMQRNTSQVYADGTSPETSIMRIFHQANKEMTAHLLGQQYVGGNLITASAEEVKAAVETYLQANTSRTENRLFVYFEKVKVELQSAAWNITWCAVPNGPINYLFNTGIMIDFDLVA